MTTASLKDIENSLKVLWTNRQSREEFSRGLVPEGVHPEIASEIDIKGVNLYSSLIRTGQNDLMQSVYPICAHLIGKGFNDVVARYYEVYPPVHHNFNRAAERFSIYLNEHGDRYLRKYAFIPELADYEWLELETMENPKEVTALEQVELNDPSVFDQYGPVVNPSCAIRKYQYPITKIVEWVQEGARLPRRVKKDPVIMAVYRAKESDKCKFLELTNLSCALVEEASENKVSYSDLIKLAVTESKSKDPQKTVIEFLQLVEKLNELELFVGSRKLA